MKIPNESRCANKKSSKLVQVAILFLFKQSSDIKHVHVRRLKEQHEIELNDVEMANENLRRKLNESRSEMQKHEELVSQLRAHCNQLQTECVILKEVKWTRFLNFSPVDQDF